MIDRDPTQLRDAKLAVDKFRQSNAIQNHMGGGITTFSADDRKSALENAWLVVEVHLSVFGTELNCCLAIKSYPHVD